MFVRYVIAKFNERTEQKAYRTYITDCLSAIASNTGSSLISGGRCMSSRFYDIIYDKTPKETRSGNEIIESIKNKLRKVGEDVDVQSS